MAQLSSQGTATVQSGYEQKYKTARMNLLLVVAFTAINLLLLITNSDSYFLFSAFLPYMIVSVAMLMCGRFPPEYYLDFPEELFFAGDGVFYLLFAVAAVLTLLYLLAWWLSSKNRVGWLIFALVFFSLDTLGMLFINGISTDAILDLVFHAWVLYSLIAGIHAHFKQKALPPEEELPPLEPCEEGQDASSAGEEAAHKHSPLYTADPNVKHRVLLETQALSYHVCYRRVKRTNELVINGMVYDRLEALIEPPHSLKAFVDGHWIEAGFTGTHSYVSLDGQMLAKKLRLA